MNVLKIRLNENKKGYVDVEVRYEEGDFTFTRRIYKNKKETYAMVEGHKISFDLNNTDNFTIEKLYETKGKKVADMNNGKVLTSKVKKVSTPKVPKEIKKKFENEIKHEKFNQIETCLSLNIPIYLAGPAGSGKNFTVEQICEENGWDFYFSNSVQQEFKLTGFIDAGGNFHETEFYKACTSDKPCVFFLDEIDASIPEVLVLLNAAIANGYFEFPNGKVEFGDNVKFVAAGNTVGTGADELYTGRMVLDQATLDRFAIIEFDYDRRVELSLSKGNKELVDFIHSLRNETREKGIRATFSYRCITMVTKLEGLLPLKDILKIAILKGMDNDTIMNIQLFDSSLYTEALKELQKEIK